MMWFTQTLTAVLSQLVGSGSPFVLDLNSAPAVVIRSGGGGCSVVQGAETSTASGLINLLLMLLPLGLIIFRKLK